MSAVGQVFAEDLSEVFVDSNIHTYLPPAARESLPHPLPSLALRVYTTVPYGTPGNVRLEHPQEIAGFYIQAAGEKVAQATLVRAEGCEQCDAAYGEKGSRQIPFFTVCRSFGDVQGGACASCVMKHLAAYCSLREYFLSLLSFVLLDIFICPYEANLIDSSQEDREPTPPPKDETPRPGERAGTRAHARKLALEAQRNGSGNAV
jgi:hypothetical protein